MSEKFRRAPFSGTEGALQPSVPVLRNPTSSAESACNFSRDSTPAVSSAWLLPSDSSTCGQQLTDSANHYQQAGMNMMPAVSQISTLALSCPGAPQWDLTGSTDRREAEFLDFTVPIIDQNTTLSSQSMTAQCENILEPNALVPSYPTESASVVQATPLQLPNQGCRLAPSYQEGCQVYYHDHNSLGLQKPGEFDQCLQVHGSVSYLGSQDSALQPEMVTLLKEIQPMAVQTPFSTPAIDHATPARATPETRLQVVEMEKSLGLTPSLQTLCLQQTPDFCNACTQDAQMETTPVDGNKTLTTLIHSPSQFLALPLAPCLEQLENNNVDEMTTEKSMPLEAYEGTKDNQDISLLPPTHTDMRQPPNYTDAGSLKQKLASDNFILVKGSLDLQDPEAVQSVMVSSIDFADMTKVVSDIHLPQLLHSLNDLEQLEDSAETQSAIRIDQAQVSKKDQKASDLLHGAPQGRIQCQDLVEREEARARACATEETIDKLAKHMEAKAQKFATRRPRAQWQDKTKRARENSPKKTEKLKPSSQRVKAEEKSTISKTKRKRNSPRPNSDSFKKPRTHLGMHMLEAVQVFHPLGKKSEKKTGISSSQALLNFSSSEVPRAGLGTTSLQGASFDGLCCGKILGHAHGPESSTHKECLSPSQYETPSPGKVKLVPLPFLALEKSQARSLPRKLHTLASRRSHAGCPVRPPSHLPQPTTLNSSQPAAASTSLTFSDKPNLPFANNATRLNLINPIQSWTRPQLAASRPAPYRAASQTSLQRGLVSAARNHAPSHPKPQTHYLVQDFSRQPIPWRKVEILGPVISQPITEKQRPEREAMKRWAQQERENAVKYPSQGKLQIFLQREEEMDISRYYGYAM
ncbi:hypothetical protein HispidOSU_009585 [Sigmodon hispidus]